MISGNPIDFLIIWYVLDQFYDDLILISLDFPLCICTCHCFALENLVLTLNAIVGLFGFGLAALDTVIGGELIWTASNWSFYTASMALRPRSMSAACTCVTTPRRPYQNARRSRLEAAASWREEGPLGEYLGTRLSGDKAAASIMPSWLDRTCARAAELILASEVAYPNVQSDPHPENRSTI